MAKETKPKSSTKKTETNEKALQEMNEKRLTNCTNKEERKTVKTLMTGLKRRE